jgi:hypothetical protein
MTEAQLRVFPPFRTLPVYDESDGRADSITSEGGRCRRVRECTTVAEVEACMGDPRLVPLGGIRVVHGGREAVVVYFGELAGG